MQDDHAGGEFSARLGCSSRADPVKEVGLRRAMEGLLPGISVAFLVSRLAEVWP